MTATNRFSIIKDPKKTKVVKYGIAILDPHFISDPDERKF